MTIITLGPVERSFITTRHRSPIITRHRWFIMAHPLVSVIGRHLVTVTGTTSIGGGIIGIIDITDMIEVAGNYKK